MAANNVPQKEKEEYITNKVLVVFSLCLGGVLLLMGVKNLVSNGVSYLTGIMVVKVLIGISAVGVIAGLFMMIREIKNHINTSMKIITGRNVLLTFTISLVIFVLIYYFLFPVFKIFFALLPALAVYYLIYHSYQPEFVAIAFNGGIAAVLLFIIRRALSSANFKYLVYACVAVMVVYLLAQIIVVSKIKANNGTLKIKNKEYNFNFSKNAYTMLFVTPVVMTILVLVGAFTSMALYAIFAVAAYLFVTAVYYTVKLM